MSARDAESGSSTYKGGSGRAGGLGNGGVGGGMGGGGNYGGGMGGGAARNGGIGSRTGLTTGNRMYGGTAIGRPGGMAQNPGAFGVRPSPAITQAPLNRSAVPGLLGPTPAATPGVAPVPEYVPEQMPEIAPPAAPYNPLTSIQPPAPPSYYMAGRIAPVNKLQQAVAAPAANWRGNTAGFSNSFYTNPTLGTPGAGGSGLGAYSNYNQGSAVGEKTDRGGGGGMRRW